MKLIKVREEQGVVIGDFVKNNQYFSLIIYESNGAYCLQIIRNNSRSKPITANRWFDFDYKIRQITDQAKTIGIFLSKEEVRDAINNFLTKIENDEKLKAILMRESREIRKAEEQAITLSDQEKEEALRLLRAPELLNEIMRLIKKKLVREERNALLVFLVMLSAKLKEPLNLRFSGESSTGKSTIIRAVARLFPPEMLIIRVALTRKALYYSSIGKKLDDGSKLIDFSGRVLILLEENNCLDFLQEFKPVLSHDLDYLESEFTDTSGDQPIARKIIFRGFPAYIGLTASRKTKDEDDSRTLLATPDKSKDKIKAVHEFTSYEVAFPWFFNGVEEDEKKLWNAIRLLESYDDVIIPYAPLISDIFPHIKPRETRDFKKLLSLIRAITVLFQKQRNVIEKNGKKYLVSHPVDFFIACEVLKESLIDTITNLEADVREFAQFLAERGNSAEGWTEKELRKLYAKLTGYNISRTTFRERFLDKLLDEGILEKDDSKKPYKYSISDTGLTTLSDLSTTAQKFLKLEMIDDIRQKLQSDKYVQPSDDAINEILNASLTVDPGYLEAFINNFKMLFQDSGGSILAHDMSMRGQPTEALADSVNASEDEKISVKNDWDLRATISTNDGPNPSGKNGDITYVKIRMIKPSGRENKKILGVDGREYEIPDEGGEIVLPAENAERFLNYGYAMLISILKCDGCGKSFQSQEELDKHKALCDDYQLLQAQEARKRLEESGL